GDPTECKILMQDYLSYDAEALKIWNEMRKLKNLVFLADHMCSEGVCVAYANETLLYMDHGHLSRSGSRYLAEQPELRALIEDFLE
ncbi:MAG: SGNH hydrolase domain-containing protein, partial [Bacteroidota bacterium]